MINFVSVDEKNQARWEQIRKTTRVVTTGVLVVYLVALAGWTGWWLYLLTRETAVSADVRSLTAQANSLAKEEVLVRQIEARVGIVDEAISKRGEAAGDLDRVISDMVTIDGWSYREGASEVLDIESMSADEMEVYEEGLRQVFPGLKVSGVTWNERTGWGANLVLKGGGDK